MAETRKIAAILAADVVGFSRMASADEDRTLARLRVLRSELIDPTVASQNGRVFKRTGDGVFAEFRSMVEAVRCAIAIQNAMIERNAGLADNQRIEFRIGIHLGDVVEESDGDLMGDGVNIAARLEGIAQPGAICLSEDAYRQVKARLDLAITDLGETKLKNIAEPIRAYALQVGAAAAPKPALKAATPEKPSIAVLAFRNMSGDPEQEYFADGITEDVITDLSKIGSLIVIARNSSFTYKGKPVDIRTVGRELGVRSVLEGSIRRAGGRVRITAQLVDAQTGGHLWAERFDRDLSDIFAVQDEVTRRIVDALKITLSPGELATLAAVETTNSKAHDFFLAGREFVYGPTRNREMFERTIDLFQKAITEDPDYGEPYAGVAWAHVLNWQNHWTEDWKRGLELAEPDIDVALKKSPQSAFVHHMAMIFWSCRGDLDRAAAEGNKALEISPNFSNALNTQGFVSAYNGQPMEAISFIERAIRLDPRNKQHYLHFLGSAYLLAGDYSAAAKALRERILLSPKTDLSRAFLAVALGHLGQAEEAQRVWRELKEINPKYSFPEHLGRLPFRNPAAAERLTDGLTKAGIDAFSN